MMFCCNELKLKLNWYICANTSDVVKNFAVINSVSIKSFHFNYAQKLCLSRPM